MLIVGGLLLVLSGSLYGAVYAGFFLPKVKQQHNDLLKSTVDISNESPTMAKKEADHYVNNVLFANRMGSVHSHMTLIGLLALTLSNVVSKFHLSKLWMLIASISLIISGFILPLGVFFRNMAKNDGEFDSYGWRITVISFNCNFSFWSIKSKIKQSGKECLATF
jgi:hypothetical protein